MSSRSRKHRGHAQVSWDLLNGPTMAPLSNAAVGLWVSCLSWASSQGTDVVPEVLARRMLSASEEVIVELVDAGVWLPADRGWQIANWADLYVPDWVERRATIPRAVREAVYERDGWACITCGTADDLTLDHIYPWILGGPDTVDNLQAMCRPCNSRKGASTDGP